MTSTCTKKTIFRTIVGVKESRSSLRMSKIVALTREAIGKSEMMGQHVEEVIGVCWEHRGGGNQAEHNLPVINIFYCAILFSFPVDILWDILSWLCHRSLFSL